MSFFYIILFIFGCAGSSLMQGNFFSYSTPASHCGGFSCCRAWALVHAGSAVAAPGLQSTGSLVVAHRLSCSIECEIFPTQGLNPCLLHWQVDSLPLSHQESPHGVGKYRINCRAPSKKNGQLMRKRPELPDCFQGRVFKGFGGWRLQLMDFLFIGW